jgi:DNA-binding GntR family transcriptional regulator
MEKEGPLFQHDRSLADTTVCRMRELLIAGEFGPGERLSEEQVAAQLGVSRNTLRESFRLLTAQGLLIHIPNRGVFVTSPDEADVIDIYRVRSVVQIQAVQAARKGHPALGRMRQFAMEGELARRAVDWRRMGILNLEFHRSVVALCDSPRINHYFELVMVELQLVFGQLQDTAFLYESYVEPNLRITERLEEGDNPTALSLMQAYLLKSERDVLAALQRGKPRRFSSAIGDRDHLKP